MEKTKRRLVKIGLFLCCIGILCFPKEQGCEVTFLDVGQGDGIYICDGQGSRFFVDGGSSSADFAGKYRILPFMKSKGIGGIDYWFVSHADKDHISGLIEVLKGGYEIRHLVVAAEAPQERLLWELLSLAKDCGTKVISMKAGDKIRTKGAEITCLYPWKQERAERNKNDASMVLLVKLKVTEAMEIQNSEGVALQKLNIETEELSILLAGDIGKETEAELLEGGILQSVHIYKVSHHGSKNSNSLDLLEVLDFQVAVVSCSKNNLYGHPAPECIKRLEAVGAKIFYTMEQGQVTIKNR